MVTNNVIFKEMIFLDKEFSQQEEIIDFVINEAKENNFIADGIKLKQAILSREQEVSTAIGFNIAMPHGKSSEVKQPFIAFLRTKEAINWDERSDNEVSLIFLIAVPDHNKDNMHLEFISQISKKLLDEEFRKKLQTDQDLEKVYELLNSINNKGE
ncbi:PTS sugar transporter subunit IIA [Aerococcaceae bacterium WGS1372]